MWSYYRHVEMVDGEIGRVMQALEETGLDKNTLVIFTSGHGEGIAEHQLARKQTAYEAAARVPLMVTWPGHVPEGKTDAAHLVTGMDIMPTVCEYAGIAPPNMDVGHQRWGNRAVHGLSISRVLVLLKRRSDVSALCTSFYADVNAARALAPKREQRELMIDSSQSLSLAFFEK